MSETKIALLFVIGLAAVATYFMAYFMAGRSAQGLREEMPNEWNRLGNPSDFHLLDQITWLRFFAYLVGRGYREELSKEELRNWLDLNSAVARVSLCLLGLAIGLFFLYPEG
ncbi:MAG: hypothetical protein NXH85_07690 [Pseudomonadaceae bacterium]|nr:hypothetical protein [Pseudomonadaceae bacterium]